MSDVLIVLEYEMRIMDLHLKLNTLMSEEMTVELAKRLNQPALHKG